MVVLEFSYIAFEVLFELFIGLYVCNIANCTYIIKDRSAQKLKIKHRLCQVQNHRNTWPKRKECKYYIYNTHARIPPHPPTHIHSRTHIPCINVHSYYGPIVSVLLYDFIKCAFVEHHMFFRPQLFNTNIPRLYIINPMKKDS